MKSVRHASTMFCVISASLALVAATATPALAETEHFGFKNLPGKTWTSNGKYTELYGLDVDTNTTSDVCVGAETKSGSGYVAPYGWKCSKTNAAWDFAESGYGPYNPAFAAVYNPNSGTIGELNGEAFW